MILSFPLGAYVVFNSDVGDDITYEFPLEHISPIFSPLSEPLPFQLDLGDAFVIIWIIFVIFFGIGIFGPKENFIKTLVPILSFGKESSSNYLVSALKWFGILVLVSAIIDFTQGSVGINIEPPQFDNNLIQFFSSSLAPLLEEIGFRVLLIGIPLYALFFRKSSWKNFIKSLWHPYSNLDVPDQKRVFTLIILVGILFGLAHIFLGDSWSVGKFTQATAGGIILGWVYYRYGFLAAVLLHWATNYFIFSYVYFVVYVNDISVQEAFSHSLLNTLELIFLVSGAVSLVFLIINHFSSKQKENLDSEISE